MLTIVKGNIFTSSCQTLVNTVNCVGVMGAGIALEFKLRYPSMFARYEALCQEGRMDIGKLWLYKSPELHEGRHWVLNFPTKKHWRQPSNASYLHNGLRTFVETYKHRGLQSVAFPVLGSQHGRIPESDAVGIMASHLYACDIHIEIYRYDPSMEDDLYREVRKRIESETDACLASKTGLRTDRIAAIRRALNSSNVRTVGQLASQKGIGEKTLAAVFGHIGATSPPAQTEFNFD